MSTNIITKIIEILKAEDTFGLFTKNQSHLFTEFKKIKYKTLSNIKLFLFSYFLDAKKNAVLDSLYYSEVVRLESFCKRLFQEIDDISKENSCDDTIIDVYLESLIYFIEDIDVNIINNHVAYISM